MAFLAACDEWSGRKGMGRRAAERLIQLLGLLVSQGPVKPPVYVCPSVREIGQGGKSPERIGPWTRNLKFVWPVNSCVRSSLISRAISARGKMSRPS